MAKDPAILLYIDKWIAATQGMKAEAKGWYLELILYQFDKGPLPNDMDELASICRIRPSEFDLFKQVFEQVLKQKFKQDDNGNLQNDFANEILQKRQRFVEKRSNAGKLSYVLKYFRKNFKLNKGLEQYVKDNIDLDIDIKDEQVLKQVFKQISELYINVNEDVIISIDERENNFKKKVFEFSEYSEDMLTSFFNYWSQHGDSDKKMMFEKERSFEIKKRLLTWKRNEKRFKSPEENKGNNASSKSADIPTGDCSTEWSE